MAEYSTLTFEVKNNVGHVAFNRPESANGINLELAREFSDAIRRCAESHEVRAVLLTGNGKLFCAGGDVKAFAAQPPGELPDYLREVTHFLHGAISTFSHMSSPIVAAVHGSAAGAGFSLACACDFVFAAETAKFTMAHLARRPARRGADGGFDFGSTITCHKVCYRHGIAVAGRIG